MADQQIKNEYVPNESLEDSLEIARSSTPSPELLYSTPEDLGEIESVSIDLNASNRHLSMEWSNGEAVALDHQDLDQSVQSLAGDVEGLTASDPYEVKPWDAQVVLQGTAGNDNFSVANRRFDDSANKDLTTIHASAGNDIYIGSKDLDHVDYSKEESDNISGLYISNDPEKLPIVSNNLPPLIGDEFNSDPLIIYKGPGYYDNDSPEVDQLQEVDILKLGAGNDTLNISNVQSDLVINFGGGNDIATISSSKPQPEVDHYINLESVIWQPLKENGEKIINSEGMPVSIPFEVKEWNEDETTLTPLYDYTPSENTNVDIPWSIEPFTLERDTLATAPDWLELKKVTPTHDLVHQERLVISHHFQVDDENPQIQWLEIEVHDYRPEGKGLIGLELNLDWKASAIELIKDDFYSNQVFNRDHLPLFQNTGRLIALEPDDSSQEERERLIGIGAAALPNANQGVALGYLKDDQPQTSFARLAFQVEEGWQSADLHLEATLTPAVGGVNLVPDDLLVLDGRSPDIWVMEARPQQGEVGSHAFTLKQGTGGERDVKHIAVAIRNVNDPPEIVESSELPADSLAPEVLQDKPLKHDLSILFRDEDNKNLQYELVAGPNWVQLSSQTGMLEGTPKNEDVGQHEILVEVDDNHGGTARQTILLTVKNINDAPQVGVSLALPELKQGQSFSYELPEAAFHDPDLSVDPDEILNFQILAAEGEQTPPDWIKIDPATGKIEGSAGPSDIGVTSFLVRVTDAAGVFVQQEVSIKVENINDAPIRNAAINEFLKLQQPTTPGEAPPSEDNPLALFTGLKRTIDLNPWFSDPDLGLDPNEVLTLQVEFDTGTGEMVDLNNKGSQADMHPSWIEWDENQGILTLSPDIYDGGMHYLTVSAIDSAGLTASALVPLLVRHRNTAPVLNISSESELITNIRREGIDKATAIRSQDNPDQPITITGLQFTTAEESDIKLELPKNLFSDVDLEIDPNENLTYELKGADELFLISEDETSPSFTFDEKNLTIIGRTHGLGLNSTNGVSQWQATLVATDAAGESVNFDLIIKLERKASKPILFIVEDEIIKDEGASISLNELVGLSVDSPKGDLIELTIEQKNYNQEDKQLELIGTNGSVPLDTSNPTVKRRWVFEGSSERIQSLVNELQFKVPNDNHAIGDFKIEISVQSKLGNTGLSSEVASQDVKFSLEPIANVPLWSDSSLTADTASLEPITLQSLGSLLQASSQDPREQLGYKIELPANRDDLLITDSQGNRIGTPEGSSVILSSTEWNEAILRSISNDLPIASLTMHAISSEPSNGMEAISQSLNINWLPSPFLNEDPDINLELPIEVQRSGEETLVPIEFDLPKGTQSYKIVIDLPTGSKLKIDGLEISSTMRTGSEVKQSQFTITLQKQESVELATSLNMVVTSDESHRGDFDGNISMYASARSSLESISDLGELNADREKLIASHLENIHFSWQVAQVARIPEFSTGATVDGSDLNIEFDPKTGAITIPFRRGLSKNGIRNPAESLTLSVKNIPSGYLLAEKSGESFKAIGASDAFGTMTLFSLPALADSTPTNVLEKFSSINNGNLYLVAIDDNPSDLNGANLELALTAQISNQPGGDSRSIPKTNKLIITPFDGNPPKIDALQEFVDPLIIDFSSNNRLSLTTLAKDGSGISFAMIPRSPAIPTAWLSQDANSNGRKEAAFLVVNDKKNDPTEGDVNISSITELLSEYFQAENRQRSFSSGSAALESLDINKDGIINSDDSSWSHLQLWFDDGDAISQRSELSDISEFIKSINLGSLTTISEQPDWAAGNAILRQLTGIKIDTNNEPTNLYDVGFRVAPGQSSPIDLKIEAIAAKDDPKETTTYIKLQENGQPAALKLISEESSQWSEDGRDSLTLVRLSGLPEEITTSLGVKDTRGDWLFTWSDLVSNGGKVDLFTGSLWSGKTNLQVLISQLQSDGSLLSSAQTSFALDVEAIANKPILKLQSVTTKEDTPLLVNKILGKSGLIDKDGSESLHYELHKLPTGAKLQQRLGANPPKIIEATNGIYKFTDDEIATLEIIPMEHFSGNLEFEWHAVASEKSNGATATTIKKALINVQAVANAPEAVIALANPSSLKEGSSVKLGELINQSDATSGLNDRDGSEQLRIELKVPRGLRVKHQNDTNWKPINSITNENNQTITVHASEIANLALLDNGIGVVENLSIIATRISREISNGDLARSAGSEIKVPFIRNARPATLAAREQPKILEDSDGVDIEKLFTVQAAHASDQLSYRISNLSSSLQIIDPENNAYTLDSENPAVNLSSLDGWQFKALEHVSGRFEFDIQIISQPPGEGESAKTSIKTIALTISPVSDTPRLSLNQLAESPVKISSNGWLKISELQPSIQSDDQDGSERFSILIGSIDANGSSVPLPSQAQFNVNAQKLTNGQWLIPDASLSKLSLYLGEISNDISLTLTPTSLDGTSEATGNSTTVIVERNLVVRTPLLEVSGLMTGKEDVAIPLLSELQGVINAQARGSKDGQTIEMEITNIPAGSQLIRLLDDEKEEAVFSTALNRNEEGNLTQTLRLPYIQWQKVHWLGPKDQSGEFSLQVQAFSVGSNGQEKSSQITTVQILLSQENDPPKIINSSDLEGIKEGETRNWNLRTRFSDIDNKNNQLTIECKLINDDDSESNLPNWLTLSPEGILSTSSSPGNNDVGIIKIKVTAKDPLGQSIGMQLSLQVGDVNARPLFNPTVFQTWGTSIESGGTIYSKALDLREKIVIDLESTFSDEDSIHGDELTYLVSRDGTDWSNSLKGLVEVSDGKLIILPNDKASIGTQDLQIRAVDNVGASVTQKLRLNVRNVNDPPRVIREESNLIRDGLWKETIKLNQGKLFVLNLEGIFADADAGDRLEQTNPIKFPSWLSYTPSDRSTGGTLSGTPGDADVGLLNLEWVVNDDRNATATYRLQLEIENVNDPPRLRPDPDLSQLGDISNGVPNSNQDEYARLDMASLFEDPDIIHGDSLTYSIKNIIKDGKEQSLEEVDWMKLVYHSAKTPNASGKILLEPVFYQLLENGSVGKRIEPEKLKDLPVNTKLQVKIEATDDRNVEQLGLIGVDLDISWSSSLELINESIMLNKDLPLFPSIVSGTGGLHIEAGAAPALGLGGFVGDTAKEAIASFDVVLKDPGKNILVGLTQGTGPLRDGLTGANAESFDNTNSVIHSAANQAGADLEVLAPGNKEVGNYIVTINATDQNGEMVSADLPLRIKNINDDPVIVSNSQRYITEWLKQPIAERSTKSLSTLQLFYDPDTRHGDDLSLKLIPGANGIDSEYLSIQDSIEFGSNTKGHIELKLTPPRGITTTLMEQQFRIEGSDSSGKSVYSDWFTARFSPTAEVTPLTRDIKQAPLKTTELGYRSQKNISLDLGTSLAINAPSLLDQTGDEAAFNIRVNNSEASLKFLDLDDTSFYEFKKGGSKQSLFSIDLQRLQDISGRGYGNLEGVKLRLPPNQLETLPTSISPNIQAGISVDVWTSTKVKGDTNKTFGVVDSIISKIWIPIENSRPSFKSGSPTRISESFFPDQGSVSEKVLFTFSDKFSDADREDSASIELALPRKLEGLVELNKNTGEVTLADRVNQISDLPTGNHRIILRQKDSSGLIGEASGIASGSVRLIITQPGNQEEITGGLDLLMRSESSELKDIFSKQTQGDELSGSESEVIEIFKLLQVKSNDRDTFINNLESGSLAILGKPNSDKPLVLLDTSQKDGALLIKSEQNEVTSILKDKSELLLEQREISETPIGELDFSIESQGEPTSIVQLRLEEGGVDLDTLFKTDSSGTPYVFESQSRNYNEITDGDLNTWLANLTYDVYYYDKLTEEQDRNVISIRAGSDFKAGLSSIGFDFNNSNELMRIDGSGYLIDLDGNGTTDLISLLIIDEGFFDTARGQLGIIGDPLIPAKTAARRVISTSAATSTNGPSSNNEENNSWDYGTATDSQDSSEVADSSDDSSDSSDDSSNISDETSSNEEGSRQEEGQSRPATPYISSNINANRRSPIRATSPLSIARENPITESSGINPAAASNLPNPIFNSQSKSNEAGGINPSNHNQRRPNFSNAFMGNIEGWMNAGKKTAESLMNTLLPELKEASELSIIAMLGILVAPVFGERLGTTVAKMATNRDMKLKLIRRDPHLSGRWLIPTREGTFISIRRDSSSLSVEHQWEDRNDQEDVAMLPGFDLEGRSLLSHTMPFTKNPGRFIRSMRKAQQTLNKTSNPDINWEAWLTENLPSAHHLKHTDSKAGEAMKTLLYLVSRANKQDPALTDALMLGQIHDCSKQLGIHAELISNGTMSPQTARNVRQE